MQAYPVLTTRTLVAIKNPQFFQPDYLFEVPEVLAHGYVNCELEHAKQWYKQIYPVEVSDGSYN